MILDKYSQTCIYENIPIGNIMRTIAHASKHALPHKSNIILIFRLIPYIFMVVLLDGCLFTPFYVWYVDPHTTPRSSSAIGIILDERTHAPIAGAEVFLTEHSKMACKSDSSGHFNLKATRNWHYATDGTPGGSGDVPQGEYWDTIITVLHTNFTTRTNIDLRQWRDDVILLKRVDEPTEPHPWLIFVIVRVIHLGP